MDLPRGQFVNVFRWLFLGGFGVVEKIGTRLCGCRRHERPT